jgi:hypothetical protein
MRLPFNPRRIPRFGLINDESGAWADQIKAQLSEVIRTERPDMVLITGGPFLYFKLGPWLHRRFGLPYVIDLRDPFINPRFGARLIRNALARCLEATWYARAKAILIPTEAMRGTVKVPPDIPVHVIENGFDDRAFVSGSYRAHGSTSEALSLVYAGKFYDNAHPLQLLRALARHAEFGLPPGQLVHVGQMPEAIAQAARAEHLPLVSEGMKPYVETIATIDRQDIGVILSGGHPFEVTTKIYDYIALSKPILGIGVAPGGGAHAVLQRYGNYQLCENETEAIAISLQRLLAERPSHPPLSEAVRRSFGRRHQAKELAALLDRLLLGTSGAT